VNNKAMPSGSSFVFQIVLEMVGHQLDKATILWAAEFSSSTKTILYPDEVTAL